jgi:hypothetical protein
MKKHFEPNDKYYGFVYRGIAIDVGPRAMRKLPFECKCGKTKDIYIGAITKGFQKTCGDCKKIFLKKDDVYHHFTFVDENQFISPNSPNKALFQCKCGKIKNIRIDSVTRDLTVKCRRCNEITLSPGQEYHGFTYVGISPVQVSPHSIRLLCFRCACGKENKFKIADISSGHYTSCGHCKDFELKTLDKYGTFTYMGKRIITSPGSHKKLPFQCECGKLKNIGICYISDGTISSCGKCHFIQFSPGNTYRDFTYLGSEMNVSKWSNMKLPFQCHCGSSKLISLKDITSGNTKTCGACRTLVYEWYVKHKHILEGLHAPIRTDHIPPGGVTFVDKVITNYRPEEAICPACGATYRPRFSDIKRGLSLTCGCSSHRVSSKNQDIASFIKTLGFQPVFEFKISKYSYDVYPSGSNVVIEYHGTHWHSSQYSHELDSRKADMAARNGYELIVILEEDWKNNRLVSENIIRQALKIESRV